MRDIEAPFFAYWLHGKGTKPDFEAQELPERIVGVEDLREWPAPGATADATLYLQRDGTLSFTAPAGGRGSAATMSPIPRNPVPFRERPISPHLSLARMALVGSGGPALRRSPPRRAELHQRAARGRSDRHRRRRGEADGVDQRHRQRLRGQADRRAARRLRAAPPGARRRISAHDERLPVADRDGGPPRPLPPELREGDAADARSGGRVGRAAARATTMSSRRATGSWSRSSRAGSR